MKDTYTEMPTFVASDGNTILVRKDQVLHYFQNHYEYNHSQLTQEEKDEEFLLNNLYADLIHKIYKQPLQTYLSGNGATFKPFSELHVTPQQNYDRMLAEGPAEHETEETYQLKLERLKNQITWIENNT